MNYLYLSGTVLLSILLGGCVRIWYVIHNGRKTNNFLSSLPEDERHGLPRHIDYSVSFCSNTVANIIDAIIEGDKIRSCRILRIFGEEYDRFDHYQKGVTDKGAPENVHLAYLWEATLKLAESGKKMVISPDYDCRSQEILRLGFWKKNLPYARHSGSEQVFADDIAESCRNNKNIISEIIRDYTARMNYTDYVEGSQKYNYLSFLYVIYSFILSMDNVMKPYRVD